MNSPKVVLYICDFALAVMSLNKIIIKVVGYIDDIARINSQTI